MKYKATRPSINKDKSWLIFPPPIKYKKQLVIKITPRVPMSGCKISKMETSPIIITKGTNILFKDFSSSFLVFNQLAKYTIRENFKISAGWIVIKKKNIYNFFSP